MHLSALRLDFDDEFPASSDLPESDMHMRQSTNSVLIKAQNEKKKWASQG